MKRSYITTSLTVLAVLLATLLIGSNTVFAHCDTMDGPVVKAAQRALDTGNVNLVLIWVQPQDEIAIKEAFQKALAVRKLSLQSKELADMYFFETLVRLHRAGEGAPYTGLKPAGSEVEPAIRVTDKALEDGNVEPLLKLVTDAVQKSLRDGFNDVVAKKSFKLGDVAAGREYVKAYVEYIHYAERIYEAAKSPAEGHYIEDAQKQEQVKSEEAKLAGARHEEQSYGPYLLWIVMGILALLAGIAVAKL